MGYDVRKAFLADQVYNTDKMNLGTVLTDPTGGRWMLSLKSEQTGDGYQGALFKSLDTGKYEFASRGTEPKQELYKDLLVADLQMGFNVIPNQMVSQRAFFQKARSEIIKNEGNPATDLSAVGDSLGASLVNMLGAENPKLKVDGFNTYGVGNLVPAGNYENITNHVMARDPVSVLPGSFMIGKAYMYSEPDNHSGGTFPALSSHTTRSLWQDPSVVAQAGKPVVIDTFSPLNVERHVAGAGGIQGDPFTGMAWPGEDSGGTTATGTPSTKTVSTPPDLSSLPQASYSHEGRAYLNNANTASSTDTSTPATTVFNAATALPGYSGQQGVTIQSGDTITAIAQRYGMDAGEYKAFLQQHYGPGADLDSIVAGRRLPLPAEVYERTQGGINGLDSTEPANASAAASAPAEPPVGNSKPSIQSPSSPQQVELESSPPTNLASGPAQQTPQKAPDQPPEQTSISLVQLTQGAALLSSVVGLQHWGALSEVQRLASLSGLYNQLDHIGSLGSHDNLPGDLGSAAAAFNLLASLEHGNTAGVLMGGLNLTNALADNMASEALGQALGLQAASVVPGLNLVMALDSGNPTSLLAAAANFIPGYGPLISMGVSLFGGGGLLGGSASAPPPPRGEVHFEWSGMDADGQPHTAIRTDVNVTGGAAGARQAANGVLSAIQQLIDNANAQTLQEHPDADPAQLLALNANLLPSVHYDQDQLSLTLQGADGPTSFFVNLADADAMGQLVQLLQRNGGIAPQWLVDTQSQRYTQLLQEGADSQTIQRELTVGRSGLSEQAWSQAAAILGNAAEVADYTAQQFGSLIVHAKDAQVQLTEALKNIDHDAYLERTQWVAAQDSSGAAQSLLIIDFNHDGVVDTRDVLNLGGNVGQTGARDAQMQGDYADLQRNNVRWLDANGDGVLDAKDPAFAAVRLFMDLNQDARVQAGEAASLAQAGVVSIDFTAGQIRYADGHVDALTAQALTGDTSGVKLTRVYQVVDGQHIDLQAGDVLEDEGYLGQDAAGAIRQQTFAHEAVRTGDWEGTPEQDAHRHGGGNVQGAPTETSANGAQSQGEFLRQAQTTVQRTVAAGQVKQALSAERVVFVPAMAAGGADVRDLRDVTAGMIQSLNEGALVSPGLGLGALAAMAMGSTVAAGEMPAELRPTNGKSSVAQPGLPDAGVAVAVPPWWAPVPERSGSADSASAGNVGWGMGWGAGGTLPAPMPSAMPAASSLSTGSTVAMPVALRAAQVASLPAEPVQPTDTAVMTPARASSSVSPKLSSVSSVSAAPVPDSALVAPSDAATLLLDKPLAQGELLAMNEDDVLRVPGSLLTANDSTPNALAQPGSPALRVTAVFGAAHGQVALVDGDVVFTPDANYHGSARFGYTVTDQYGLSSSAVATLEIGAVNDAPVTQGEASSTDEDVGLVFSAAQLLANDSDADVLTDGQTLSISRVGQAQHATVSLRADGTIVFVPEADFNGLASFTYWVSDGAGGETPATVAVRVLAVNDLPVARSEQVDSEEDVVLRFTPADLLANDSDVDVATNAQVLEIASLGQARHGTVAWVTRGDGSRAIEFTPQANFHGVAGFDYTVSDGAGGLVTASVVFNLAAVNDTPVAPGGQEVDGQEDAVLVIEAAGLLANVLDPDVASDGQTLRLARVAPLVVDGVNQTHGTVSLNASGDVVFTPEADYNGSARFTYWVQDDSGAESGAESGAAVATIHLAPVNDAPGAQGETLAGASEDAVFNISAATLLANDADIDDAPAALRLAWVGNASHGTVALDAQGNVVFTPQANFNGYASFSYTVRDAAGLVSPLVLATIPVAAVNDAPLGVDDQFSTYRDGTMRINYAQLTGNDVDVDGDALSVSAVRARDNGEVSLVNGAVQFVPTVGFAGTASFDYLADDGQGGQTWATAYVNVLVPPKYPTVNVTLGSAWVDVYHNDAANLRQTFNYTFDDENPATVSMTIQPNFGAGFTYAGFGNVQWVTATDFNIYKYDVYGNANISLNLNLRDEAGLTNTAHVYVRYTSIPYGVSQFQVWHDYTGYATPVVLDLDGQGLQAVAVKASKLAFDVDADGTEDRMAAMGAGNGLLTLDLDGDGKVSSAGEFAFQQYVKGARTDLEGLAAFDSNHDGRLDPTDERYARFAVWQDRNGNGQQDTGEYQTLAQLNIASIDLYSNGQAESFGDVVSFGRTQFTRTDGSTGTAYDAMLAYQSGHDAALQQQAEQASPAEAAAQGTPQMARQPLPGVPAAEPPAAAHALTAELSAVAPALMAEQVDAHNAEAVRMALLFNQMCNTAVAAHDAPLGFVPLGSADAAQAWLEVSQAMAQAAQGTAALEGAHASRLQTA